uniref:Neuronal PAS domain-containing protein 4 n=1 Tax=Syphacia muris TaxID=451379 RepID=A0A0N5AUF8_9BILA
MTKFEHLTCLLEHALSSITSTRGASKQRRDQINVEIQKLRDLLPLSESIKDRLFQLQVMSLACIFIRKQRYLPHIVRQTEPSVLHCLPVKQYDGCKALRGFLLMVTKNGKMLYISENASEYLGHSVEEIMCQGDSVYDLVDSRDHLTVQNELMSGPPSVSVPNAFPEEKVFICRMNLSRTAKRQLQYHKFILIEGRYLHPAEYYQAYMSVSSPSTFIQPIFAAYCQPLINPENAEVLSSGNTSIFRSVHLMDMKFLYLDDIGAFHLGYQSEDLEGKSWYKLLHPSHLDEVAYKHRLLCQEKEGSVICLLRLQNGSGNWLWLHTVLAVRGNFLHQPQDGRRVRHLIYATYQLLSDMEVATLQANSWIYSIRHSYPSDFSCKDELSCQFPVSERSVSSISPISPYASVKNEPYSQTDAEQQNFACDQIHVEIPLKIRKECNPSNSHANSEHSSPESNRSLST